MAAPYLEVWTGGSRTRVALEGGLLSVGKAASNDVVIPSDRAVSHLHAVLERYPAGWAIRDLTSQNGTFVNGARLLGERRLRNGDEIRLGRTTLTFHGDPSGAEEETGTLPVAEAPELTRRERDVLLALCRPLFSADMFTEPAATRAIADELSVSQAAVKQHLSNLYDKFGIYQHDGHRRRVELANAAINTGAITLAELRGAARDRDRLDR